MSERSKVSNELLKFAAEDEALNTVQIASLWIIADRIDAEMVELPKDRDGVPIHVGDTVWNDEGYKLRVVSITSYGDTYRVHAVCPGCDSYVGPEDLTRNRPDSFERIADELEKLSESNRINGNGEVFYRAGDLAERIRKLAKEGE